MWNVKILMRNGGQFAISPYFFRDNFNTQNPDSKSLLNNISCENSSINSLFTVRSEITNNHDLMEGKNIFCINSNLIKTVQIIEIPEINHQNTEDLNKEEVGMEINFPADASQNYHKNSG